MNTELKPNCTEGASVEPVSADSWRLGLPPGAKGKYRLAQLDDYRGMTRGNFPWKTPLDLTLSARVSSKTIPGTWGFGLWNDPFSLSLGFGGGRRRFPTLPNAAWFFFASPQNYLSFRDDKPGKGYLCQTFRSPNLPATLLALSTFCLPVLVIPRIARMLRSFMGRIIQEDSSMLSCDVTQWHSYRLDWNSESVNFQVDEVTVYSTETTPKGPLGLVFWIDNQYLAFPPNGKLAFGTLENKLPVYLEIKDITVNRLPVFITG